MASDSAAPGVFEGKSHRAGRLCFTTAGLIAVVFWLMVGDLGIAMRDRAALASGLELLRRNAASDTTTSLLLSTVPALLSVLLVPFIGYHSDRFRSRWGRRRPFLIVMAPIGCAAMLGLAFSPDLGAATDAALAAVSPGLRTCTLAYFCLFWTSFECAAIGCLSLFTGLVNDVVPHGLLGRFYAAFRIVGLSVGIAFNTWMFALTDHYLFEILITIALVFGSAILLMCVMIREAPCAGNPDLARAPAKRSLLVPRAHVLECFTYRPYLWAVAAFMFASVTFSPFNAFYQYYAHVCGISKSTLGSLTAYGYAVSIVSAFAIGWLVDRFGAVRISSIVMMIYCGAAAMGYLWLSGAIGFQVFYLAHVIISGAFFTAAASMPMALFPLAQFVQYNSTKDLMVVFGTILVSSIQGPILDISGHNYHLTLLSGALFSLLCIVCLARLQARKTVQILKSRNYSLHKRET
jgi:Na+/melibiose symporter-like transporter